MSENMSEKSGDQSIADRYKPYKGRFESYRRLPEKGRTQDDIFRELSTIAAEEDARWTNGRVSGTFYHAGEAHRAFLNRVFSLFSHVNVLQMDICPSMSKLEAEIVAMTAGMLHGDAAKAHNPEDAVCGSVTSGGSESIMVAVKVYRDRARAEKGITAPELIVPRTAHPAFHKACEYFELKKVVVPVDEPDYRVDPGAVEAMINANTVAIVGSAGNYPYGLVDPIEDLSDIAVKHDVGLHVDGCLGGFILSWAQRLGYDIPVFDFRLPGLTSISADTHKYGFGLKGTSVVLYRNKKLRRYQYFGVPDFPGGVYASPTMSGSRSGGLLASTWAAMVYLGEEGYLRATEAIMKTADRIKEGVGSIPELTLIGEPTFVVSFRSDELDVFHINDDMSTKGWRFNVLQLPPALHFCVTMPQTLIPDIAEQFMEDLRLGVKYAKSAAGTTAKTSALYGIAGSPEGNAMLGEIMYGFFDHIFEV